MIRNIPSDVQDTLDYRAGAARESLQHYTWDMIAEAARRRPQSEVFAEIRRRARNFPQWSADDIVAELRASREEDAL